jgi:hypothetical protein
MQTLGAAVAAVATVASAATPARAQTVFALSGNDLIRFEATNPSVVTTVGPLDAFISGLDFRPQDGRLYGYAANLGDGPDAVYVVDTETATLTLVAESDPGLPTALMGIDFDPLTGDLRAVTDLGDNRRITPDAPATVEDAELVFASGDTLAGRRPLLLDIAYAPDGTLYGIDYLRDSLVRFDDPNAGTARTVGRLGLDTDRFTSFDIALVGGVPVGYATLGPSFNPAVTNSLFTINLGTGAASRVGSLGVPGVNGVAVAPVVSASAPEPSVLGLVALAFAVVGASWLGRKESRK